MKPVLRNLNRTQFGDIVLKSKEAYNRLCDIQKEALINPTQTNFLAVSDATNEWNHLANIEEQFFKQKSRVTWLSYGDHNTAFFHRVTKSRAVKNAIKSIITENGDNPMEINDIKNKAVRYFTNFLNPQTERVQGVTEAYLEELLAYRCPDQSAASLVKPISGEEIKEVI